MKNVLVLSIIFLIFGCSYVSTTIEKDEKGNVKTTSFTEKGFALSRGETAESWATADLIARSSSGSAVSGSATGQTEQFDMLKGWIVNERYQTFVVRFKRNWREVKMYQVPQNTVINATLPYPGRYYVEWDDGYRRKGHYIDVRPDKEVVRQNQKGGWITTVNN